MTIKYEEFARKSSLDKERYIHDIIRQQESEIYGLKQSIKKIYTALILTDCSIILLAIAKAVLELLLPM